jgi:cation diffusion facilitator CzcD-associated flavoprotein CzcO
LVSLDKVLHDKVLQDKVFRNGVFRGTLQGTEQEKTSMSNFEVLIVGAGQAGIPLARALAHVGQSVALIERKHLGGSCVNFGCTPTKAAISSAKLAHQSRRALRTVQVQHRERRPGSGERRLEDRTLHTTSDELALPDEGSALGSKVTGSLLTPTGITQ